MSNDVNAPTTGAPEAHRPLPDRPNLEFERKRAKKLLRELRRTHAGAKLADAQHTIAREYGFMTWPKLVLYFETSQRHEVSALPPAWYPLDQFERSASGMLAQHARRSLGAALSFATFVPRFFGKTAAEVMESPVRIDDARLVVARANRMPSWVALQEYVAAHPEKRGWDYYASPERKAYDAMANADRDALGRILDANPELLHTPARVQVKYGGLARDAVMREWSEQTRDAREMTEFLASRGADVNAQLNWLLFHFMPIGRSVSRDKSGLDFVEYLIARGADPGWIAPNGMSVIEHLILRPNSAQVVDAIAKRAKPRKAFWIAAGLGDVRMLRRFFAGQATLTAAARRDRPDFLAAGHHATMTLPDASDLDIMWEAFFIASMHRRTAVLDALLEHGLPVEYTPFGQTMLSGAIQMHDAALVEYLLSRGASTRTFGVTAEQMDEWLLHFNPIDDDTRRIYELCGGKNADAIIRQKVEEKRVATLPPFLLEKLDFARHDAARLAQAAVEPHNLFVALLGDERFSVLGLLSRGGVDIAALRRAVEHRFLAVPSGSPVHDIPMSAALTAILEEAKTRAEAAGHDRIGPYEILHAMIRGGSGTVEDILTGSGGSMERIRAEFARVAS